MNDLLKLINNETTSNLSVTITFYLEHSTLDKIKAIRKMCDDSGLKCIFNPLANNRVFVEIYKY